MATTVTATPDLPLEGKLSKLALEQKLATNWTLVGIHRLLSYQKVAGCEEFCPIGLVVIH